MRGTWAVARGARAFALAGLFESLGETLLVVAPGESDAFELAQDLRLFSTPVCFAPAWETLPFEHVSPNLTTMAQRAEAREALSSPGPALVVSSVRGAIQRVAPSSVAPIVLAPDDEWDLDDLADQLASIGYQRTDRVEARGEFAIRGGIVDVFAGQSDNPVRLEFWGEQVETIKRFAIGSQRSLDDADRLVAFPVREVRPDHATVATAKDLLVTEPWAAAAWDRIVAGQIFAGIESWLPWLAPERSLIDELFRQGNLVLVEPERALARSRDLLKEETDLAAALAPTWGENAPDAGAHPSLFLDLAAITADLEFLSLLAAPTGPSDPVLGVTGLEATPGSPESVAAGISRLIGEKTSVVVALDGTAVADRVHDALAGEGLALPRSDRLERLGSAIIPIGIHNGFIAPDLGVAVLGEQEVAGRRRAHRRGVRRQSDFTSQYKDLAEGDHVVHYQHGIGKFEGLVTRTMMGVERDYLIIAYAGDDRLYVPVDRLASVKRYTGGEAPRVSRIGGKDWSEQKARVRREVAVVASQVVKLHRQRALTVGHAFEADTPWQGDLEASFEFEETPDQLAAVADVKSDMESELPMDRLVFGDVGFGKTEVAIRAAFKAVQDGLQVAVLCPTTLLAQQHHQTFTERFAGFPVEVEVLSRFLTPKQQSRVVARLATGEADVVVGTHRLLSEDVFFRNLGLLVIDEEQRFGVGAKDAIKRLRVGVDVLTLSATPIPRTLEMALTGIRDVSHIRTAPEDRHPILTYVGPYDDQTVSAAIRRELLREGQVFYVHNRVRSIDRAVARLQDLAPGARYVVAHGQMSEGSLEQVMIDFWNHEYDVLVATTIIESGLDLPKVNTLIVERADMLGLSQIYQLRGRVGRSRRRAYAYLFHPREQSLTEDAYRRLEAIGEATDLGSGFQLALRDLEIRGAGSFLGEIQSGHISAVGFDLYQEFVAEAVSQMEGRDVETSGPPQIRIDLPVDAHLPTAYVSDQEQRLEAYRRLAAATTDEQVLDVAAEWVERFGELPEPATALIALAHLRVEALRVGIDEVVRLRNEVRLSPVDLKSSQEVRLRRLEPKSHLVASEGRLFIPALEPIVETVTWFVQTMWPSQE